MLARVKAVAAGCLLLVGAAVPAWADRDAQIEALMAALRIADTITIMQQEGAVYGADIATSMVPDADAEIWADEVSRIYDAEKMEAVIREGLASELTESDLEALLSYYATPEAQEIVSLEISARRAFLDPDVEAMTKDRYDEMAGQGVRLLEQVDQLIADSDLVDRNVAGALNSDLMFYRGLADGGAYDMSEEDMLREVWAGEAELRESSEAWLNPFLMLAYRPLEPDVLDSYIAFWRSDEGKALNRAIFAGFDQMYEDISYLLGRAVANEMVSEKL